MKYDPRKAGALRGCVVLAGALVLASCGTTDARDDGLANARAPLLDEVADFPVKIGDPYEVDGVTYTPRDVASYDEVGYASWYGEEMAGGSTANGERFVPDGISAAHKTLPLPSYVEVTALDTGRTILLRVNDRGPFAKDRLIDLSAGAARQLGIVDQGVTGVRVRKVNPNEQERALLRSGRPVVERSETPDSLLTILRTKLAELPRPAAPARPARNVAHGPATPIDPITGPAGSRSAAPAPNATSDGRFIVEGAGAARPRPAAVENSVGNNEIGGLPGTYFVQIAAFASKARADALAEKAGATVMSGSSGGIWRVRYGPYADKAAANEGLDRARRGGYRDAAVLRAER